MPTKKYIKNNQFGLTLVELLIALTLMGFISLSIANFLMKGNVTAASLRMRFSETTEIQALLSDIQQDFKQGSAISNNSYSNRLEYTTYDATGVASKKIYRLITISGKQYLQFSSDGGSNWVSPYRISSYDQYVLQGTPKFLYSGSFNNCTDFADTSPATPDGVWTSGSDSAGVYLACINGTSSPALSMPSQASKVAFHGFQFSTGKGSPEAVRALPADVFMTLEVPVVRSTSSVASPAIKDSPLLHFFVTNTAASTFGTAFDARGVAWDPSRERLVLVGRHSSGSNTIYLTDRRGIMIQNGLTTSTGTIQADSVAVEATGGSVLVLDAAAKYLYEFNITATPSLSTISSLNLSSFITTPFSIAYDADTPTDFYLAGYDSGTSSYRIYQRNQSTGALVGSAWSLPAAFDASHPPSGLAIEPLTGDFLLVRNYINGSAPNQTIDIYRIARSNGSSSYFSININDLGSSASGTNGYWGLGYDPITNRLFLSDSASGKVYEVIPSQLITARS